MDRSFKKVWDEAHLQLRLSLQKEISALREVLANLCEEELSLQLNDQAKIEQVLSDRSQMIDRLNHLRSEREDSTKLLEKIFGRPATFEELFPIDEPENCEILSLRDQLLALIERINQQNSRNQHVHGHPYPHQIAKPTPQPKKKTYLETIDPLDHNEEKSA